MNCVEKATNVYLYTVAFKEQAPYLVDYRWCDDHNHVIDPQHYPMFTLKEHRYV